MHRSPFQHAPARAAAAAFALIASCASFLLSTPARAADEFAVTAVQMKDLGIALLRLDRPADIQGQAYPARVVLPPAMEQVVSAPLAGLVDRVLVGENDVVRAGQPLLRLISPELGELQLRLIEAEARSRLSQKTLQRERSLAAEGIIAERRVQEAEGAADEASARLRQTEAALRLAGLDAASIRKVATGGGLQDGLTVVAKSAGTVLALSVKTGQRVAAAEALMHVADTRQLWLDIQVPADRRGQFGAAGSTIAVIGREAAATPMNVSPTVGDNQTLTLRARVTQGAGLLRAGEFVQVQVPFAKPAATGTSAGTSTGTSTGAAWAVPVPAVVRQNDKAYVFVRTDKGFRAQVVSVLTSAGNSVQVQGPLQAGQDIAVTSVIALKAAWMGKSGSN